MVNMPLVAKIKTMRDKENKKFTEIAEELSVDRKTVSKWYNSKEMPMYKRQKEPAPVRDQIIPYLQTWINEDQKLIEMGKKKHFRPASTMWHDLIDLGIKVGERTVRRYVSELKPQEVFIELEYDPGKDMQVDWGETKIQFEGGREVTIYQFVATLPYSNTRFVYPYLKQDGVCFFDGLKKAFDFIGGVPRRITFDNLSTAVKKVLKGPDREETDRMLHFKQYYGFESNYCAPAKGNEKGSVENGVGFVKRRFLSSNKVFKDMDHLRNHLSEKCIQLLQFPYYKNSKETINDRLEAEKPQLLNIPSSPYDISSTTVVKCSKQSMVIYDGVRYSIPCNYAGKGVTLKATPEEILVYNDKSLATEIARHKRVHKEVSREVYNFRHFLPVFLRKSRAFDQAKCIRQFNFPKAFWQFHHELQKVNDKANREMVMILMLEKKHSLSDIFFALDWCIEHSTYSYDAVKLSLNQLSKGNLTVEEINREFPMVEIPPVDLSKYDLLGGKI